jgi:hypothetical protein
MGIPESEEGKHFFEAVIVHFLLVEAMEDKKVL